MARHLSLAFPAILILTVAPPSLGMSGAARVTVRYDGPFPGVTVQACPSPPGACSEWTTDMKGAVEVPLGGEREVAITVLAPGFLPWTATARGGERFEVTPLPKPALIERESLSGVERPGVFPIVTAEARFERSTNETTVIKGNGGGWRIRRDGTSLRRCEIDATPTSFVALLTTFYEYRFFDLRERYSLRPTIRVDEARGTIGEGMVIMGCAGGTRLTLRLGDVAHSVVTENGAVVSVLDRLAEAMDRYATEHCGPESLVDTPARPPGSLGGR